MFDQIFFIVADISESALITFFFFNKKQSGTETAVKVISNMRAEVQLLTFSCFTPLSMLFFFLSYSVHGLRDLVWLPIEQYRKDGRIVRGFQRGTASFGTSTAMAALELTNRMVRTIQVNWSTAANKIFACISFCKARRKIY